MALEKYVFVVEVSRWSDDWPRDTENVYVVNGSSRDDMPASYQTVYVINGMSLNDRPSRYSNVYVLNGIARMSDDWPSRYENVYVENFEVLKKLRSLRKVFNPSLKFLQCNWCFTEFEAANSLDRMYRCPRCGHVFHEIESLSR